MNIGKWINKTWGSYLSTPMFAPPPHPTTITVKSSCSSSAFFISFIQSTSMWCMKPCVTKTSLVVSNAPNSSNLETASSGQSLQVISIGCCLPRRNTLNFGCILDISHGPGFELFTSVSASAGEMVSATTIGTDRPNCSVSCCNSAWISWIWLRNTPRVIAWPTMWPNGAINKIKNIFIKRLNSKSIKNKNIKF